MDTSNQVSFPREYEHLKDFDWKTPRSMNQLNSDLNGKYVVHHKLKETMENPQIKIFTSVFVGGLGLLIIIAPVVIYGAEGFPRVTHIPLIVFESVGGTLALGSAIAAGILAKKLKDLGSKLLTPQDLLRYKLDICKDVIQKTSIGVVAVRRQAQEVKELHEVTSAIISTLEKDDCENVQGELENLRKLIEEASK